MEQEELGHGFKLLKSQYVRLIKAEIEAFGDRSLNKKLRGSPDSFFCLNKILFAYLLFSVFCLFSLFLFLLVVVVFRFFCPYSYL